MYVPCLLRKVHHYWLAELYNSNVTILVLNAFSLNQKQTILRCS